MALRCPASPIGDTPLTPQQELAAWDAGYECASYLWTGRRVRIAGDDAFLWCVANDPRIPNVREGDPSFWEWVQAVSDGAAAYHESLICS